MVPLPKLEGVLFRFNQLKQFLPVTDTGQYREGLQNQNHGVGLGVCENWLFAKDLGGRGNPSAHRIFDLGFLGAKKKS